MSGHHRVCCCGPPTGACCAGQEGTTCIETTEEICGMVNGTYRGDGSSCSDPEICPEIEVGACCVGASCFPDLSETDCTDIGGIWLVDTVCLPNPCSIGACCRCVDRCDDLPESECDYHGGTWQGEATRCADVTDECDNVCRENCATGYRVIWSGVDQRYSNEDVPGGPVICQMPTEYTFDFVLDPDSCNFGLDGIDVGFSGGDCDVVWARVVNQGPTPDTARLRATTSGGTPIWEFFARFSVQISSPPFTFTVRIFVSAAWEVFCTTCPVTSRPPDQFACGDVAEGDVDLFDCGGVTAT